MNDPSRCWICDSMHHVYCGFCSRCREHCVFVRDPEDPQSEALSDCCGASGWAYDDDPPNYREER